MELVWETVPRSRSSGAKAAVSELGSCTRLHVSSCVGGSKSRTTAGLCNCLPDWTQSARYCGARLVCTRCIMRHSLYVILDLIGNQCSCWCIVHSFLLFCVQMIRNIGVCLVCKERRATVCVSPCSHTVICYMCAMIATECPQCGAHISPASTCSQPVA